MLIPRFPRPAMTTEDMVKMFKQSHTTSHLFMIDNFSLLIKYKDETGTVESSVFDLAGHKWKLLLDPDDFVNGSEHVSISLENQNSINLKLKYELFVLRQHEPMFHTLGKWDLWTSSTSAMGYPAFLSIVDLTTKGYLIGDCVIFGVKIYGYEPSKPATAECFRLIEKPPNHKVTWMMTQFSSFNPEKVHHSNEFAVGNRIWRIEIHPRGCKNKKDKSFSVYLVGEGFIKNAPKMETFAKFKLRVLDQVNRNHIELPCSDWIDKVHGFDDFMPLKDLIEPYLVKDKLYVGVEFDVISVTNYC